MSQLRAAHDHHQDQPGEDPRRDRQGRRGDPRADRGNRHDDRHRGRRHGHHRLASTPTPANVAKKRIEDITAEVEVGRVYEGTVLRLLDFGAIVQVLPGKDGLLHISQIANERVNQVSDYLKEGQVVTRQGARGRRQGPPAPVDEGGGRGGRGTGRPGADRLTPPRVDAERTRGADPAPLVRSWTGLLSARATCARRRRPRR